MDALMAKAKALPRGQALEEMDALYPPAAGDRSRSGIFREVDVDLIEPNPFQPRRLFDPDELAALGESIYQDGQQQPIGLRPHPTKKGRYQIIWGERRWRAVRGHPAVNRRKTLDAMVRQATDTEMADLAIIENIQRADLTPAEEIAYVKVLRERGHNDSQIAVRLNQTTDWVRGRSPLIDVAEDVAWMLDYPESLTFAKETNKLTGRLRGTVIAFVRSRVNVKSGTLDLSVKEFRDFITIRGGVPRAIRTTVAPPSAPARALPSLALTDAPQSRLRYEWEEDVPATAAPRSPAPDVHPSAVPHTVGRILGDSLLLDSYARQFHDSDPWGAAQRDEMVSAIRQSIDALEAAQELLEGGEG